MRDYKAIVRNRETKAIQVITLQSTTVDNAAKKLNRDGYSIVNEKIFRAEKFDRIVNNTPGKDWDWHSNRPKYKNEIAKRIQMQMPLALPAPQGKKVKCGHCGTERYKGHTCVKCNNEVKTKYQLRKERS